MGFKDQMAVLAAPVFLRLAIALTFVWAGLGKLTQNFEVSGADAAYLANIGALDLNQLAGSPAPGAGGGGGSGGSGGGGGGAAKSSPSAPFVQPLAQSTSVAARTFTAADFPTPVSAAATYRVSLLIRAAAEPGTDASGAAKMRLWPTVLAEGQWPRWLALAVALTETVGGVLVFVGLFTRLWGFMLAGVMLGVVWLTLIGPAIQSGKTQWFIFPADMTAFDPGWIKWFWVFGLLMSCLALTCAGAGAWSLDALFRPAKSSPKPAAPKPAGS